ncbi:chaperonin 10-like protein [Aspergillus pseudodeflectus]|uniref:Chaperonin 10-like protein n=1 Tax=Aspergillus pseudodeflectus TaxID=176178 RepID=A0ABR4K4B9_9EURO
MAAVNNRDSCIAGCVTNPGPHFEVVLEEVPIPEPGDDELLLRLNVTGLCYSDIHYMLEDLPMPRMSESGVRSPGHEGIGCVVKVGKNVTGWAIGQRAGVKPVWDICHECELCLGGLEAYCARAIHTGLKTAGTYQSYVISPARYTTRIPDEVDDYTAAPLMCAGATMFSSIRAAHLSPGSWVVVLGAAGGVGHIGVQIARALGMRVIGIDGSTERRNLCMQSGCEAFIDFVTSPDVKAEVMDLTERRGAQGVFVVATSPSAYSLAPELAGVGGRVMCVGLTPAGMATVGGDPALFIGKHLHVIGTQVGSMHDANEVLKMAAEGRLKPIYKIFPVTQLPEAVRELRAGKAIGRCVVDFRVDGAQR